MPTATPRDALLFAFAIGLSACDVRSPSGPTSSPPVAHSAPSVTAISPSQGSTLRPTPIIISGTGFQTGATVTIDVMALKVTVVSSTLITAIAPVRAAGTADVVVTNPDGLSGTLPGTFSYSLEGPFTLTPSANTVDAGGELSVGWTAPTAQVGDWIALFKVGRSYEDDWYGLTNGETTGTRVVSTPTQPGLYEFRYLVDDGFVDVARSIPVTVR